MFRAQHRRLENPNEVRTFPFGRVEIYEIGDVVVGRQVFEPGWRWSLHIQPIAGTSHCEYHHMGYVISGTMRIVLEDGTSYDVGPDEAYEIPPRHDAWVLGDQTMGQPRLGRNAIVRAAGRVPWRADAGHDPFTDLVDSTATATKVGDGAWRDTLALHNQAVRFELDQFRGREIHTTGGRLPGHLRRRGASGSLRSGNLPRRPGDRAIDAGRAPYRRGRVRDG